MSLKISTFQHHTVILQGKSIVPLSLFSFSSPVFPSSPGKGNRVHHMRYAVSLSISCMIVSPCLNLVWCLRGNRGKILNWEGKPRGPI